jgi:GNAT superfamily N-acetyltransferase
MNFAKESLVSSLHSSLVVTAACLAADVCCACDIMIEAADWLAACGQPLWNRESLTPANVLPLPDKGSLFLAHLAGHPVGAFILLFEDPFFWPDVSPGEALYLHRLVVRRSAAGTGVGYRLLEHAVAKARTAGRPFLRLDCAPRPKLCAFYEAAGFCHHSDRAIGSFSVRRYQRSTESPA